MFKLSKVVKGHSVCGIKSASYCSFRNLSFEIYLQNGGHTIYRINISLDRKQNWHKTSIYNEKIV